jgi:hypothetical protein
MKKVTTEDDTNICSDKNDKQIFLEEIATFVHLTLFYGKSFLIYTDSGNGGGHHSSNGLDSL